MFMFYSFFLGKIQFTCIIFLDSTLWLFSHAHIYIHLGVSWLFARLTFQRLKAFARQSLHMRFSQPRVSSAIYFPIFLGARMGEMEIISRPNARIVSLEFLYEIILRVLSRRSAN